MGSLNVVVTLQAIVFVVYGLPYLLFPAYATTLTQQMPLPENYTLRALGIAFVMLGYLEFQVARDLERYRNLAMTFGVTSALFFITIALQMMLTGFNGALWYWWVNLVVTGVFAIAVLSACRKV
jgi:uncharacterized protein YjeT (DUF2065 family)